MLRFYFPQSLEKCKAYLSPAVLKNDLIMLAEEDGKVKAICTFMYSKASSKINNLISCDHQTDILLMDGLFRTVLFHLLEMECKSVIVKSAPEIMNKYFEGIGFKKNSEGWFSDHFAELLFSGCQGCKKEK